MKVLDRIAHDLDVDPTPAAWLGYFALAACAVVVGYVLVWAFVVWFS